MWIKLLAAATEANTHHVYEYFCGGEFPDCICFVRYHLNSQMVACRGSALKFELQWYGHQYPCSACRHNRSNSRVQLRSLLEAFRSSTDVNGTGSGQHFIEVGTAAVAVSCFALAVRYKSVRTAVPFWSELLFYDHQHDGWILGKLR